MIPVMAKPSDRIQLLGGIGAVQAVLNLQCGAGLTLGLGP